MRITLSLQAKQGFIPINYFHQLSASIYHSLHLGSPEFSEFLHNTGYKFEGKSYKLFTFALLPEKARADRNRLLLLTSKVDLIISTYGIENFLSHYLTGLITRGTFIINSPFGSTEFDIQNILQEDEPDFTPSMKFTTLSPIVFSTGKIYQGKVSQYYLRHNDLDEINRVLNINLKGKFGALAKDFDSSQHSLKLKWDEEFIENRLTAGKRITKKVTIMGANNEPIDIIGLNIPFEIFGNPDSIRILYYSGFGEKNASGFGCVNTLSKRKII